MTRVLRAGLEVKLVGSAGRHSLRLALVWLAILAFVRGGYGEDRPCYLAFQIYPASGPAQMRQYFPQPEDLHILASRLILFQDLWTCG
jgi:hypothetical protein